MLAGQTVNIPVNVSAAGIIATAVAGLLGGIALYLKSIKKDTVSTHNAVNNRAVGEPTISKQVSQSASDIIEVKYDVSRVKQDITEIKASNNRVMGLIETLLAKHVETQSKVEDLVKAVPKRREDYNAQTN